MPLGQVRTGAGERVALGGPGRRLRPIGRDPRIAYPNNDYFRDVVTKFNSLTLTAGAYNCNKSVWYVDRYQSAAHGTLVATLPGGTDFTREYHSFSIRNN
ncbi:MAG: hypothetical protein LC789_13410 [Actinobacteria bacterium]|nr:hypothetical protein [Actinomycetota bacterium]MCA1721164.1 hypothetical protein [Actinomycetota bacterium]